MTENKKWVEALDGEDQSILINLDNVLYVQELSDEEHIRLVFSGGEPLALPATIGGLFERLEEAGGVQEYALL